eukprot:scaffold9.g3180.t1
MADLLNCPLLNVGGRTYRVYSSGGAPSRPEAQQDEAVIARGWEEEEEEDGTEGGPPIEPDGAGWKCVISLDSELYGLLIGQKGKTRQRIEQDTGAQVVIPRREAQATGSAVTLRGASRGAVARARTQVQLLVSGALQGRHLDYNYFLSLPLATPETSARLATWRQAVLADAGSAAAGIEQSIFMHEQHLHLTLVMLKLYSDEARALAQATLRGLQPAVAALLAEGPLRVHLKGLEYMNDDPGAMHVLYLGVKDGAPGALDRLRRLCALAVTAFSEAGLLQPQDERPVKLHTTVINTRYRKRAGGGPDGGAGGSAGAGHQQQRGGSDQQRQPFDGRALLAAQGQLDLGVLDLPALCVSQRGRYDAQTGYYATAAALPLAS